MTIPRLKEMNRHWREFPPPHVQLSRLAIYFGFSSKETAPEETKSLSDFISDFMAAGGKIDMPSQPKE